MEILRVENLTKSYGKNETKVDAIKNVSLSVEKGTFIAITGPSGSGKSTLLHLLGGVDRPTSGKVYINDVDIYNLKTKDLAIFRRRNIGLIYQFYNLIPVLNVKENILLPAELDNRDIDGEYFDDLMET
ncbi:TPA: ABC transporter ATP-binding protein, partial [Clostridioides difficile]